MKNKKRLLQILAIILAAAGISFLVTFLQNSPSPDLLHLKNEVLRAKFLDKEPRFYALTFSCSLILLTVVLFLTHLLIENAAIKKQLALRLTITEILCKYDDLSDASTEILSCISEQLDFVFAAIWTVDKETNTIKCTETWQSANLSTTEFRRQTLSTHFQPGIGLPGRVWSSGKLNWIENVQTDTNYPRAPFARQCGIHSGVAFPMVCGNEVWGIMEFYKFGIQKAQPQTISLLNSFGSEFGQCIERWKSHQLLKEEYKRVRFVAEVTDCLTEVNAIDEMLRKCTDLIVRHLGGAFARIWLVDPDGKNLELRASSGMYTHIDGAHRIIPVGKFKIGMIAHQRKAHFTNDVLHDPQVSDHEWAKREGLVAFAGHPLILENQVIGVMALFAQHALSERTISALNGVANGIALGIKHRQEREKIAYSEGLFHQLTENIREVFFVLKPGPELAYVSPAYEELWGRSILDLQKDISEFYAGIAEEDREKVKDFFAASKVAELAHGIEFRVVRPDRTMRWIWLRVFPTFDQFGKWNANYGIAHDVSERKEAETRVNEFYSMVSHELRTPLTSIHASLRLMEGGLSGKLGDKTAQLVTIARTESDRLIRLINDILDLRKLQSGKLELKKRAVCTSMVLMRAATAMKGMADASRVTIETHALWDGYLHCDEDRILQVLENLISNAIKFSPVDSLISCRSEQFDGRVRFSIIDQGPGIEHAQQSKLFNKFQQLNSTDARPKGGTGLGLAISKAIVEEHHGKIGVISEIGCGSTFWFELPCSELIDAPEYLPITRHEVLVLSSDERLMLDIQTKVDRECFIVHCASTTEEAQQIIRSYTPEAVIWDTSFTSQAIITEALAAVPVILVTDCDEDEVAPKSRKLKSTEKISHRFRAEELHAALCRSVRVSRQEAITVLIVENQRESRELLKCQLGELRINIVEVDTGEEAIARAIAAPPDLIILDIELPGMNGYQLVQQLRKSKVHSLPLLVYTCHELERDEKHQLTLGRTRYLTKSQTSDSQLTETVKLLLNGLLEPDTEHHSKNQSETIFNRLIPFS